MYARCLGPMTDEGVSHWYREQIRRCGSSSAECSDGKYNYPHTLSVIYTGWYAECI